MLWRNAILTYYFSGQSIKINPLASYSNMAKHLKIFFCLFFVAAGFSSPAHAQVFYRDVTLKESLVSVLYQYGKETFYRGIDPQGASFTFQRILVLNCGHHGAQAFLDKIHHKYPDVTIKIRGCSEVDAKNIESVSSSVEEQQETAASAEAAPSFEATASDDQSATNDSAVSEEPLSDVSQAADISTDAFQDYDQLRRSYQKLQDDLSRLDHEIKEKDSVISDYQKQLRGSKGDQTVSYAAIAQDQKDLIRIQQGNIDYLKNELAEAKKHTGVGAVIDDDEKYGVMHREIAGSNLTAQEKAMDLIAKDNEAKILQEQLEELEEQLRLVQEIVKEKNALIQSLQEELKAVDSIEEQ